MKRMIKMIKKFILQEAEDSEVLNLSGLDELITDINNWVTSFNQLVNLLKEFKELENIFNSLDNDIGRIKQKVQNFLSLLVDTLGLETVNNNPEFKNELEKLYTKVQEGTDTTKEDIKSDFDKISIYLERLNKTIPSNPLNTLITTLTSLIKQTKQKLNSTNEVDQQDLDLAIDEIKAQISDILSEAIGTYASQNFEDDLFKDIQNAIDKKIDSILENTKAEQELKAKSALFNTMRDWQDLLDRATNGEIANLPIQDQGSINKNLAAIWNLYFEEEWGPLSGYAKNIPQKVKNLGQAFIQEVLELGFDKKTNPFIDFLSKTIESLNLTNQTYTVLHNNYVKDIITDNDLRGTGILGTYNLIFTLDLYKNNSAVIDNFLSYQAAILEFFAQNKEFKNILIKTKYQNNLIDFHTDVFYTPGEPTSQLKKRIAGEAKHIGGLNLGKLKAQRLVYNELSICFSDSKKLTTKEQTKMEIKQGQIQEILNKLNNDKTFIKEAIIYLLTTYLPSNISSVEIEKILTDYDIDPLFSINIRNIPEYLQIFKKYNITDKNILQIIKELAEKANLNKAK